MMYMLFESGWLLFSVPLIVMNKPSSRAIMSYYISGLLQLCKDVLGKDFTEFNSHLIKRINTPNNTLHENFMFVQRNQRSQSSRRQKREHDTRARPIPSKHLTLHQRLGRTLAQLLSHLLLRLAKRQRLGLREKIGKEDTVVLGMLDRVLRGGGGDEVGRDEFGALVDELVE